MSGENPLEGIPAERVSAARAALNGQDVSNYGPYLIDMADSVLLGVEEIDLDEPYPEDRATEVADGAVPVYTHTIMRTIAEAPYLDDGGLGPAFDGSPTMSNIAAAALYNLASNIAHQALQERRENADADA